MNRLLAIGVWRFFSLFFLETRIPYPSILKVFILRIWGCKIGWKSRLKGPIVITDPWKLTVSGNVTVGEFVYLDTSGGLALGSDVIISQNVCIYTGNHDFCAKREGFRFFPGSVVVGDRTWIAASCTIRPGSRIPPETFIKCGSQV